MVNQSLNELKTVLSNLENMPALDKPGDRLSLILAIAHIKDAIMGLESIE
jgi:hypothetical protein